MKKRITKNLIMGIGSVLSIVPRHNYIYPSKGDLNSDIKKMEQDAITFSRDLCSVTERKYGTLQISKD